MNITLAAPRKEKRDNQLPIATPILYRHDLRKLVIFAAAKKAPLPTGYYNHKSRKVSNQQFT